MNEADILQDIAIIRSSRKTLSLEIKRDGKILVRAPLRLPQKTIEAFIQEKADWIRVHREKMRIAAEQAENTTILTAEEIKELYEQAAQVIPGKVHDYAALLGVTYGRITIRNQRTRWGSCSAAGNLNFNCLLMLTPPEIQDYVVVHELCHRREMNHSSAFWEEVEKILPDYRERRQWLKLHEKELIRRCEFS